jgi:hypothetical protein
VLDEIKLSFPQKRESSPCDCGNFKSGFPLSRE